MQNFEMISSNCWWRSSDIPKIQNNQPGSFGDDLSTKISNTPQTTKVVVRLRTLLQFFLSLQSKSKKQKRRKISNGLTLNVIHYSISLSIYSLVFQSNMLNRCWHDCYCFLKHLKREAIFTICWFRTFSYKK